MCVYTNKRVYTYTHTHPYSNLKNEPLTVTYLWTSHFSVVVINARFIPAFQGQEEYSSS